jgi:hypothetical protein
MSTPKPRIRPKADPHRQRNDSPPRDPASYPERDPHDRLAELPFKGRSAAERVIFQEDDCLR